MKTLKHHINELISKRQANINISAFNKFGRLNYNSSMKKKSNELRYTNNLAEVLLWNQLKRDLRGVDFHRQKAIGNFIVDFFCPELMLVIEIDGKIHDEEEIKKKDQFRQQLFEDCGLIFLRYSAYDIFMNMYSVIFEIENYVKLNKLEVKLTQLQRGVYNRNKDYLELLTQLR